MVWREETTKRTFILGFQPTDAAALECGEPGRLARAEPRCCTR
jgi:hypothetical protein